MKAIDSAMLFASSHFCGSPVELGKLSILNKSTLSLRNLKLLSDLGERA